MPYRLTLLSDADLIGGAEQFLAYLGSALPVDVHVSMLAADPSVGELVAAAAPHADVSELPSGFLAVRAALAATRPDVVLVNLPRFSANRIPWLAALTLRRPVVVVDHAPTRGLSWRGRLAQRVATRRRVTRVAVGIEAARRTERWGGLPGGSVRWIHNGVPERPPRDPSDRNPPVVGFMGRLDPVKGVDVLLRAMTEVAGARLDIAGEGPLRDELVGLAESLGLADRVTFRGFVASQAFYGQIDVLAISSHSEGLPLVLLESMFVGVPVVATAVGGIPEALVDGVSGRLVPPNDPHALAQALRELLDDPQERAALAIAGRRRALEEFTAEHMASRYDALFRSLTDSG